MPIAMAFTITTTVHFLPFIKVKLAVYFVFDLNSFTVVQVGITVEFTSIIITVVTMLFGSYITAVAEYLAIVVTTFEAITVNTVKIVGAQGMGYSYFIILASGVHVEFGSYHAWIVRGSYLIDCNVED